MVSRRRFAIVALVSLTSAAGVLPTAARAHVLREQVEYTARRPAYRIDLDRIVDSRGGDFVGFTTPSINDHGTIAFLGYPDGDGGGAGIFTTRDGRHFKTIVTSNHPKLSAFGPPSINNLGLVAFEAVHHFDGTSDSGVYTAYNPQTLSAVATTEGDSPFINFGIRVSLNDWGQVAFHAHQQNPGTGVSQGIFLGQPWSAPRAIATTVGYPEYASFGTLPHINNWGTVVFSSVRTPAQGSTQALLTGQVRWNGAVDLRTLFDNRDPTILAGFDSAPYINDRGVVSFGAPIKGRPAGLGIFTSPGDGSFEAVATTFQQPFGIVRESSVNGRGTVVFPARKSAEFGGGQALYAKIPGIDAPVAIVEEGQRLFGGSRVEDISFFRGLNEKNEIAFHYRLRNGVEGIAVARIRVGNECD